MPDQQPNLPKFVEPPRQKMPAAARDPQKIHTEEFLKENADLLQLLDHTHNPARTNGTSGDRRQLGNQP